MSPLSSQTLKKFRQGYNSLKSFDNENINLSCPTSKDQMMKSVNWLVTGRFYNINTISRFVLPNSGLETESISMSAPQGRWISEKKLDFWDAVADDVLESILAKFLSNREKGAETHRENSRSGLSGTKNRRKRYARLLYQNYFSATSAYQKHRFE